jgi:hypothetical protein
MAYPPGLRLVLQGLKRGYMAEPGSLTLGIPSRKPLWAAQAKVSGAIVTMTQRKRLRRRGQKAQEKAPAADPTDRSARPQNPSGKHRPTDATHGHWERHNLIRAAPVEREQVPTGWRIGWDPARSEGRWYRLGEADGRTVRWK